MKTKELILKLSKESGIVHTSDIVKRRKISRQAAAKALRELAHAGLLVKTGSTRNAAYLPAEGMKNNHKKILEDRPVSHSFKTKGLEEDRVFSAVSAEAHAADELSRNAFGTINYAFTEMLNNAIEHSKAQEATVIFGYRNGNVYFEVVDRGIGAFESVREKFKLQNCFESVEHLLKGKQSTAPEKHTGEGIFYTSKIADIFILESGTIRLIIDNRINDVIVEEIPFLQGTRVTFMLNKNSRKDLEALFKQYTNNNVEFDKTRVTIKLSKREGEHISRSQARRLLFGLDKFKRIVLDFKGVAGIGQGFADEIFRVFHHAHPDISFEIANANESVEFMIKRAKRSGKL